MKLPHKLPGITREELILASAWLAIKEDNSKSIHLEPGQAAALVTEHNMLTAARDKLRTTKVLHKRLYEMCGHMRMLIEVNS